jgi:hypothetical protein
MNCLFMEPHITLLIHLVKMCQSSGIVVWVVNCIFYKCLLLLLVYFIARGLEKHNIEIVQILRVLINS